MVTLVAGLAAVFGIMWPDFDLSMIVLTHRSGLTHSLLLPLLMLFAARRSPWIGVAVAGLSLGIAVHLAADVFPQSMRGFATVKLPLFNLGGGASRLWLATNAVGGVMLGLLLVDRREGPVATSVAAAATAVLATAYFILHHEPVSILPAMAAALAIGHGPARRATVARLRAGGFLNRILPRP